MRETIEFRIPEASAQTVLPDQLGKRVGIARQVVLSRLDPLVGMIRELDRSGRLHGRPVFTAWQIRRSYTQRELGSAELFMLAPSTTFEPAGEECGTVYVDDGTARGRQLTPLKLRSRRLPQRVDLSSTIAGELVVTRAFRDACRAAGLTGWEVGSIILCDKDNAICDSHFQLNVTAPSVRLHPKTRVGEDPFREGPVRSDLVHGEVAGLNLISEVWARREDWQGADFSATAQLVGTRQELLRPGALLLVSAAARRALIDARLRGLVFEVAHLV